REQPEEWAASLERLGPARSRVKELLLDVPTLMEEALFQDLVSSILQNVWIAGQAALASGTVHPGQLGNASVGSGPILASGVLQNVIWTGGPGHLPGCGECVFLTNGPFNSGVASARGQVYLVQLKRTNQSESHPGTPDEHVSEAWEPVVPDTN